MPAFLLLKRCTLSIISCVFLVFLLCPHLVHPVLRVELFLRVGVGGDVGIGIRDVVRRRSRGWRACWRWRWRQRR